MINFSFTEPKHTFQLGMLRTKISNWLISMYENVSLKFIRKKDSGRFYFRMKIMQIDDSMQFFCDFIIQMIVYRWVI